MKYSHCSTLKNQKVNKSVNNSRINKVTNMSLMLVSFNNKNKFLL